MKKSYQRPAIEVVRLQCMPLLTASFSGSLSDETIDTSSSVLSPKAPFPDDLEDL